MQPLTWNRSYQPFSPHLVACRRFTPLLVDLYNTLKTSGAEDFEIVFLSMDKTDVEYAGYTSSMPWWSLPRKSPLNAKLASMYEAQGIPHLVVIDRDSTILVPDGVGEVTADPSGRHFPWRPKPISQLLPSTYLAADGSRRGIQQLAQKYLLLYFSAHWCPPCQQFTPKLAAAYLQLRQTRSDDFEILFVSSDHDPQTFDSYFRTMPFGAIPYEDRAAKTALSARLQIRGIPTLVVLDKESDGDRVVINKNVRPVIESGDLQDFPFWPKPHCDLNKTLDNINATRCVIVFCEGGDDEEQHEVQEALKVAGGNYSGVDSLRFFWANSPTGLTRTVRDALRLGPINDEPVMVLLDIPDGGSFYVSTCKDITASAILAFAESPGQRQTL